MSAEFGVRRGLGRLPCSVTDARPTATSPHPPDVPLEAKGTPIPAWLEACERRLHESLRELPPEEALLFSRVAEQLRDAPYRVPTLDIGDERSRDRRKGHAADPGDADVLRGILAIRLYVMHEELNPLVTSEESVQRARCLLGWLAGHEAEARRAVPDASFVALRYDTLAALNPPPDLTPTASQDRSLGPGPVRGLVSRWERARAAEPWTITWRKKLAQQADFYRHFASMPAYALRRRRIRSALTPALRENPIVMETFSAIEQVGPIVDGFVFRARGHKLASAAGLSDLAFLYMQMADELVDNLVHHLGTDGVRALVDDIYPRASRAALFIPFEDLDARTLTRAGLDPETAIPKYDTDVRGMLALLAELREIMLGWIHELQAAGPRRVPNVSAEVQAFFHHCFATYLDELFLPSVAGSRTLDQLPIEDVQWHFYRKNNVVMMRFMALRARLTGLLPAREGVVLERWGYLLATFQIFDDMKDVWVDLGFQPNYALQTARQYFPAEYDFLARRAPDEARGVLRDEVRWLNTRIPRTILHCVRLSRLMALSCFDYLALYAWDHRWRRNWMGRLHSFNREGAAPHALEALRDDRALFDSGVSAIDALLAFLFRAAERGMEGLADGRPQREASDEALSFALDVLAYDHPGSVYRAAMPSLRRAYRYLTLRMMLPAAEKVALLSRLLRRHRGAWERGLEQWAAHADAPRVPARLRTLANGTRDPQPERFPGETPLA